MQTLHSYISTGDCFVVSVSQVSELIKEIIKRSLKNDISPQKMLIVLKFINQCIRHANKHFHRVVCLMAIFTIRVTANQSTFIFQRFLYKTFVHRMLLYETVFEISSTTWYNDCYKLIRFVIQNRATLTPTVKLDDCKVYYDLISTITLSLCDKSTEICLLCT